MRDPLDDRSDSYQVLNAEAERLLGEGKVPEAIHVSPRTAPAEMHRVCELVLAGAGSEAPGELGTACHRLTTLALRLQEDLLRYGTAPGEGAGEPLPAPEWLWQEVSPEPFDLRALVRTDPQVDPEEVAPIRFRTIDFAPLSQYDEISLPEIEVSFEE